MDLWMDTCGGGDGEAGKERGVLLADGLLSVFFVLDPLYPFVEEDGRMSRK